MADVAVSAPADLLIDAGARRISQRAVLSVVLAGMAATSFPMAVLIASLDTIRADLGTTLSTISWVQVAPSLAAAVSIPILGKLCDLWGGRRMFVASIGLQVVFSLLTALAWDAGSLIALRTLGQLAGSATGPAGFTIVGHYFTGTKRAKAIGSLGTVSALSPLVGIIVGGPLIDWLGWQTLFLLQAIPAAGGFLLALRWLPDTPRQPSVRFDVAGALLLAGSVTAGLFGLNRVRAWGLDHPGIVACFVAFPVLAVAFFTVERRIAHPLAPLKYLTRRDFAGTSLATFVVLGTFTGTAVLFPLLLFRRYGYDLTAITLLQAARPVGYSLGSWLAPRLRPRFGHRDLLIVGTVGLATAGLPFVYASGHRAVALLVLAQVMTGLFGGLAYTTLITVINELADPGDVGIANGMVGMTGTMGGATGVTLASAITADSRDRGPFETAFVAFVASAALGTVLTAMSAPGRRGRANRRSRAPAPPSRR